MINWPAGLVLSVAIICGTILTVYLVGRFTKERR